MDEGVGAALLVDDSPRMYYLLEIPSVCTTNLLGINIALNIVMPTTNTISVFTDFLSTLLTFLSLFSNNQLHTDIFIAIDTLSRNSSKVIFCSVSSHFGIADSESVGELAKKAIKNGKLNDNVPLKDVYFMTKDFPPICGAYGIQLTIKHIFIESKGMKRSRRNIIFTPVPQSYAILLYLALLFTSGLPFLLLPVKSALATLPAHLSLRALISALLLSFH